MNIILTISSIVLLIALIINFRTKQLRKEAIDNLNLSYEEIEMYFIRNNIPLKKDYIELLKSLKNLVVNTEYLDIQILLLAKIATEKKGNLDNEINWVRRTIESLPKDFRDLYNNFNQKADVVVFFSFFKPDFILFIASSIFRNGIRFNENKNFIRNHESIIASAGFKMAA